MGNHATPRRTLQRIALAIALAAIACGASAATPWIAAAIDSDDNASTGCTIATADGPLAGIDLLVTTHLLTTATNVRVARLERQVCSGGTLVAPTTQDASGWPVGLGAGDGGNAVVETYVPRAWIARLGTVKVVVLSGDGAGGGDATGAFRVELAAPAAAPGEPLPVPFSPWLALPLALAIGWSAYRYGRRRPEHARIAMFVVVLACSGLALAATVVRDGAIGDWRGIAAAIVDPAGDAPPDADIVAVYFQLDDANLYLRVDADIRRATTSNNTAPTVSAGAGSTITLPNPAALAGSASDDGLPMPPGALTSTWSVEPGAPGPVTFGDPAKPATSATFTAPGVYTLRLSANDGELSTSATTTVTVVDGAPTLAAVADRTIALGTRLQIVLEAKEGNAGDLLTFSLPTAPPGASLNPAPLVDWVPGAGQLGTHPFTARVTDGGGKSATASFNVTVVHTNHPPALGPQASLSMQIGTAFARTLTASDPDDGDVLTFALVSGPNGMTLTGADLAWSTSGRNPGDYAATVKVTDSGGLSDQKTFTLTLQPAPPAPAAKDDSYKVKIADTLTVPALGVLANDINPGASALVATKLTDPGLGSVTAFGSDGGFAYQAPATPPGTPFTTQKLWSAAVGVGRYHELVADLNGDGYPDVVSFDFGDIKARSGLNGSQLWASDMTGAPDCTLNSGGGSMDSRVLADLDDSGHPALAETAYCGRAASNWHDNIVALDHLGKVKWVSPPLSKPHPDIRHGTDPVPPGGFTPGGLAWRRGLSVARLTAGGAPVLLMRVEIPVNDGYTLYYDAANAFHYAGCRAVTGLAADENVACRATLIISGTDGSVLQTLVVRDPAAVEHFGGPNALSEMPPIAMDIDGDGRVDLVSGTEVWMQNAGGGFDFAWNLTRSVNDTAVADLDGDGKAEIIHIRSSGESNVDDRGIFIYGHDGQLKRTIPLWTYWFTPLTIADVDGDGRSDIVLGGDGTFYAFRDDGRPIWAYKVPADLPDNPVFAPFYQQPAQGFALTNAPPQVYDLDGDGVAEVVVAAYSRILILNGRTGARKIDPYWTYAHSYNDVSALMLIDMNNDGHVDIVQNSGFVFNCGFVGANFLQECINLIGPTVLKSGSDDWLPGPKAFPHVQYRSTAIDGNARVLHDTKVSRVFRTPEQQGTVRDPRLSEGTSFTYEASNDAGTSPPATVFIEIVPNNEPPVFTSTPPKSLWQHFDPNPPGGLVTHFYDVSAIDPDPGDTITFSLKTAPSWVTMSGPSRIRFEPTCGSYGYPCAWGQTTVIVTATDSRGAGTDQIFIVNLTTTAVTVPDVVGMSLEAAQAALIPAGLQGVQWAQQFDLKPAGTVLAQEAAAGAVVGQYDDIRLTVSQGPEPVLMPFVVGMQLAPANGILASAGLTVNVSTTFSNTVPAGEVTAQSPAFGTPLLPATAPPVELTVSAGGALAAPVASIVLQPGPGPFARLAGEDQQFKAVATLTDGTSADVSLTAAWSTTNAAAATVNVAGFVHAKASGSATIAATLSGKSGSVTVNVSALVPGDNTAPVAAITSPADDSTVTGPVTVTGTATDPNFLRYELAYAPAGDANFTVLSEGTSAVTNGALGTFDPTTLLNDLYTLRLRVFDRGENVTVAETTVQTSGRRKLGLFSLAFTDLSIAMAGVPIDVVRTYDSRDKATGDFGVGWRLGLRTLRLRTNRVLGTGWIRVLSGPASALNPTAWHKVSVTLPDGHVDEFDIQLSPTSGFGLLTSTRVTGFAPRFGTQGTLEVLGNTDLLVVDAATEHVLVDDSTLEPYDPRRFRYTSREGTRYEIDRVDGVTSVEDIHGNKVTIGRDGIEHSSGRRVSFVRDTLGRIASIVDPNGRAQAYAYDGNGDLVSHVDAVGGASTYAYDGSHGLTEWRNALGVRVARNDYDETGRLVAMTDAAGRQVTFDHDEAAGIEVVTDRRGNVSRLHYDAAGNVTREDRPVTIEGTLVTATSTATFDALGNETSRVDADGRTTSTTFAGLLPTGRRVDPSGLDIAFTVGYTANGSFSSAIDPAGRAFAFGYDGGGGLVTATSPEDGTTTFVNDATGQLVERIDALGNRTVITRDASGRVARDERFDAASTLLRRTDFSWDANGNLLSRTLHRTTDGITAPLTTSYAYDAANRLVAETDPLGGLRRTEYDAAGRVAATIDALGRRTSYDYDELGQRTRTTHPDATFETATYDEDGNVVATTDRAGRTTTHTHDELRRRVRTTLPGGATTNIVVSPAGQVTATIDARGFRTDYAYDAAGRRISTTQPAVADGPGGPAVRPVQLASYDALGRVVAVTDAKGRVTQYQFDSRGRLVKTTHPGGATTLEAWDALGRRTQVTDADGKSTTFAYDGLGRIVSVAGVAGTATYSYDQAGNRIRQTDALGRVTQWRYDALDRLVERRYPGGESERFAYDAVGNLVSRIDAMGRLTTFAYDAMGNEVRRTLPGGATVDTTYAPDGQRATVVDARGTTTYAYDAAGRLATLAHPGGETVAYAYDANGNLVSLASPSGTAAYAWDALDRLVQMTSPEGTSTFAHDLVGNMVRRTAPNGVDTDIAVDARDRATSLAHRLGGTTLQSFTVGYSPAGRRTGIAEVDGSQASFAYDALGRLVSETRTGTRPYAVTHAFDAAGNRTQTVRNGAATTFAYDTNDQLTQAGATAYAWDANGNLATRTATGVVTQFGFDAENRLVSVLGGGLAEQFLYDADGHRVRASGAGGTTRFLVDTMNPTGYAQVIEERDGLGTLTGRQAYGMALASMTRAGAARHVLGDPFGSVRALTDGAGAISDSYLDDAYGVPVDATGATPNPYRYRGERVDAAGLYDLRARAYDPSFGRFLSRDPFAGHVETPLSFNRYLYANGDPANHIDPAGAMSLPEISVVTQIFAGLAVVQSTATFAGSLLKDQGFAVAAWTAGQQLAGDLLMLAAGEIVFVKIFGPALQKLAAPALGRLAQRVGSVLGFGSTSSAAVAEAIALVRKAAPIYSRLEAVLAKKALGKVISSTGQADIVIAKNELRALAGKLSGEARRALREVVQGWKSAGIGSGFGAQAVEEAITIKNAGAWELFCDMMLEVL